MRNPIILLLSIISVCALFFLVVLGRDVKILVKQNQGLKHQIDSLNEEISIRDIDNARYDLILEKFRQKHPYEFNEYLNETE